jgi:hypothetical protein
MSRAAGSRDESSRLADRPSLEDLMRTQRFIWALAAAALVAGCADYGAPDEVLFGTAVFSQPKPGFDPATIGTYYIDTSAVVVGDDPNPITGVGTIDLTNPTYSSILDAIDGNMQALGYAKRLTRPAATDAGNAVIKLAVLQGSAAVYYPGYWCDYWYYYSCYYNWYYGGSYAFGTVLLDMGGLRIDQKIEEEWVAAVYGVATGIPYDVPRIVAGINRAYAQSPYLAR